MHLWLIQLLQAVLNCDAGRLFWGREAFWVRTTQRAPQSHQYAVSDRKGHPGVLCQAIVPHKSLDPVLCLIGFSHTSSIALVASNLSPNFAENKKTYFSDQYLPRVPLFDFVKRREDVDRHQDLEGYWYERSDIHWNDHKPYLDNSEMQDMNQFLKTIQELQ